MIRIYLDWSVISSFKRPEYQSIAEFIDKNKRYLLFPYSPAHFTDLMKSYDVGNKYFNADLDMLEYLSGKHHIRWEKDVVKPLSGKPKDFFNGIKVGERISDLLDMEKIFNTLDDFSKDIGLTGIGTLMKSMFKFQPSGIEITEDNQDILKKIFPNLKVGSSMWDLIKEIGPFSEKLLQDGQYYKDFRGELAKQGFKLDPNSGNWSYDQVIKNIDDFLVQSGTNMTYLEYVQTSFKYKKEPITQYEYYTTAYLMLDMIGYKIDKLPKPTDNLQNIQADGEHSFYGAHCDYFVTLDKKLMVKSKVLYNEFNIDTKIIEPKDFIEELGKVIDPLNSDINFIQEALLFCKEEYLIGYSPDENGNGIETFVFELPKLYFNFFNQIVYIRYPEKDRFMLIFRKEFKNLSNFIFYTEAETLVDSICDIFGYNNEAELAIKKYEFVYTDKDISFNWSFDGGVIRLDKEEDTKRPSLSLLYQQREND